MLFIILFKPTACVQSTFPDLHVAEQMLRHRECIGDSINPAAYKAKENIYHKIGLLPCRSFCVFPMGEVKILEDIARLKEKVHKVWRTFVVQSFKKRLFVMCCTTRVFKHTILYFFICKKKKMLVS